MKKLAALAAGFLLAGCSLAGPPRIPALSPAGFLDASQCTKIFPAQKWQFVHAIQFTLAGGSGSTILGVTTLSGKSIRCALMTIEGLTLFEAQWTPGAPPVVKKALPPFDTPAFADGLMADIRTLFVKPAGQMQPGHLPDGQSVCRFETGAGDMTDVIPEHNHCWSMQKYAQGRLERRVSGCWKGAEKRPFPDNLILSAYGAKKYTLHMSLLQADAVP